MILFPALEDQIFGSSTGRKTPWIMGLLLGANLGGVKNHSALQMQHPDVFTFHPYTYNAGFKRCNLPSRGLVPNKKVQYHAVGIIDETNPSMYFSKSFFRCSACEGEKSLKAEGSFQVSQNVAVSAFTMILVFEDHHLAVLQRSPTCHHVFSNVVGPPLKKHANMCTVQSENNWIPAHVLLVCHQLKNKVIPLPGTPNNHL